MDDCHCRINSWRTRERDRDRAQQRDFTARRVLFQVEKRNLNTKRKMFSIQQWHLSSCYTRFCMVRYFRFSCCCSEKSLNKINANKYKHSRSPEHTDLQTRTVMKQIKYILWIIKRQERAKKWEQQKKIYFRREKSGKIFTYYRILSSNERTKQKNCVRVCVTKKIYVKSLWKAVRIFLVDCVRIY